MQNMSPKNKNLLSCHSFSHFENGKQIAMAELQVGDQVQTGIFKQCIYDN